MPSRYSKVVSQVAWKEAKDYRWIWWLQGEKTSKNAKIDKVWILQFLTVFDVFPIGIDQIGYKSFVSVQVPCDTSLEYPQGILLRIFSILKKWV